MGLTFLDPPTTKESDFWRFLLVVQSPSKFFYEGLGSSSKSQEHPFTLINICPYSECSDIVFQEWLSIIWKYLIVSRVLELELRWLLDHCRSALRRWKCQLISDLKHLVFLLVDQPNYCQSRHVMVVRNQSSD